MDSLDISTFRRFDVSTFRRFDVSTFRRFDVSTFRRFLSIPPGPSSLDPDGIGTFVRTGFLFLSVSICVHLWLLPLCILCASVVMNNPG